ncbi:MAG: magnesium transporter CorA [Blastochloris viridis]|uniref:Magnesium transport protein CorA n=1 Tax=Blastochloris viridis TaxID=1079 RepID=A0A6N4R7N9_BLAVI|nr:MAG: magnesium transporter CorA [Blastochloris viridis]
MITIYARDEGQLKLHMWMPGKPFPTGAIWVDAERPSLEELALLQQGIGLALPSKEERDRNFTLSRMFKSDGVSFMIGAVITKTLGPYPEIRPIKFILTEDTLLTIRDIQPTSFENFSTRLMGSNKDFESGPEVLHGLLEEIVLRVAFNADKVVDDLDKLSHRIFDPHNMSEYKELTMRGVLRKLGAVADLNSQIHESLHSVGRMIAFFKEQQSDNHYLSRKLEVLSGDVRELTKQTGFQSDKITFQLDAALGMINVEQNLSMKILSVFTVFLMPPTLIGSIYGMNFHFMPELSQPWGYPFAIILMLASAIGPYLYFRKRRWL